MEALVVAAQAWLVARMRVPIPEIQASTVVLVLDLSCTFVFALSGAMAGIKHRFDIFGVLVLSFAAANVGGIIRDVLIGAVPPPGIADWRYVAVPVLAGLFAFYSGSVIDRLRNSVEIFVPLHRGRARWRRSLLRAPLHGNPTQLAVARCPLVRVILTEVAHSLPTSCPRQCPPAAEHIDAPRARDDSRA